LKKWCKATHRVLSRKGAHGDAWQKKKTKNAVVFSLGHLDYKYAKNSLKDPIHKNLKQNLTDRAVNSKSNIKGRPTKPLLNRFIRRTDLIEVLRKEKKWLKKVCRIFLADQKKSCQMAEGPKKAKQLYSSFAAITMIHSEALTSVHSFLSKYKYTSEKPQKKIMKRFHYTLCLL